MNAIIVDDEESTLFLAENAAKEIEWLNIKTFTSSAEALNYLDGHKPDIAILDIKMDEMNGVVLGGIIRGRIPDIMLVYMTGEAAFPRNAMVFRAAAYLLKPFSTESFRYAVESAQLLSLQDRRRKAKKIYARTFGYFDLFVNDKPVMFKSAKAKELLALLIDRQGGTVTTDQIIGTLWENRPNDIQTQNLCSKVCKKLEKELEDNGAGDILISSRGVKRLDIKKIDCDLYMLLEGDKNTREKYIGEYMMEYSWSENRIALLNKYIST